MSPDPPPPMSVATAAQHSSSHGTMSSSLSSQKSVDLAAHGPSCPAPSPYDSSADDCDDCGCVASGGCDTLSQWSVSPGLPTDATSQQAYDPTITAYNDVDYVATVQPSPTG